MIIKVVFVAYAFISGCALHAIIRHLSPLATDGLRFPLYFC